MRWYESAFGPLSAGFWTSLIPETRIDEEAQFLARVLAPPVGGLLLDAPSGAGRQARALAKLGFRVEGIDISEHMLAQAQPAEGVTLRQADITSLEALNRYDGAYCWGNSFGYLSDDESQAFVTAVGRALKPGARFVLESGAVAENLLPSFQKHTDLDVGGYHFTAERRYEMAESAMYIRYRIARGADSEEFEARQAVYTAATIVGMAARAELKLETLYGGIGGEPAAVGKPLIAVFRR